MEGLILSCIVNSIRSLKDGSVSVTLETQELNPSKAGELFGIRGKIACVYISPKDTITAKELKQIDELDAAVPGKTQSQRIRAVLYLLHQQNNEGYKDFAQFYQAKTELFIETLKSNLP